MLSCKWLVPSVFVLLVALFYPFDSSSTRTVYVIGDLHGDVHCARHWVHRTGLLSDNFTEWLDPSSKIVFLGDYIDKGPTSKQTLEFVKLLTERFPEHVTALLGNHEMELLRDRDATRKAWGKGGYFQLSYAATHPAEYLNYLHEDEVDDNKDEVVVEALYNASMEVYARNEHNSVFLLPANDEILRYIPEELRQVVKERLLLYQKRYLDAFRTGTPLGTWLEQRPIVALEANTLFVHGGINARAAQLLKHDNGGLDYINSLFQQYATEKKLNTFLDTTMEGQAIYEMLTFRGNHNNEACHYLAQLLPEPATRLAVGHTPNANVEFKCGGRFLALDSSLGRHFRNSGNEYCRGDKLQHSSNKKFVCRKMNAKCQGQIVQIVNDEVKVIEAYN